MRKKFPLILLLFAVFTIAFSSSAFAETAGDHTYDLYRLGGSNRFSTAVAIADAGWSSSSTVVLANGYSFADALAGGPLASYLDAPILLAGVDSIDSTTVGKIQSLNATTAYILGGTGAISESVETQLRNIGITEIVRVAGATRYGTSAAIATKLKELSGKDPETVFVAYGNNYPDALSISPVAGELKSPILYAPASGSIDSDTSAYLSSITANEMYILGGPGVISSSVADSAASASGISPSRVYGSNRYDTSAKIYEEFGDIFGTRNRIAVATGTNFPDALAGGVFAAKIGNPLVLVNSNTKTSEINNAVRKYMPSIVYVFGGTGVVSDNAIKGIFVDEVVVPTPTPNPGGGGGNSGGSGSGGLIPSDPNGTVYLPMKGSKYHSKSTCSGMTVQAKVTVAHAKQYGFSPCGKCVK